MNLFVTNWFEINMLIRFSSHSISLSSTSTCTYSLNFRTIKCAFTFAQQLIVITRHSTLPSTRVLIIDWLALLLLLFSIVWLRHLSELLFKFQLFSCGYWFVLQLVITSVRSLCPGSAQYAAHIFTLVPSNWKAIKLNWKWKTNETLKLK